MPARAARTMIPTLARAAGHVARSPAEGPVIVFGTRMYGKVDQMPEGYVATQFVHVWFVPLIPLSSMIVTAETGNGVRGAKIGWSGKSILAAYVRAFGGLATLGLLAMLVIQVMAVLSDLEHAFRTWDVASQAWVVDWALLVSLPATFVAAAIAALAVAGSYWLLGKASDARRAHLLDAARRSAR